MSRGVSSELSAESRGVTSAASSVSLRVVMEPLCVRQDASREIAKSVAARMPDNILST